MQRPLEAAALGAPLGGEAHHTLLAARLHVRFPQLKAVSTLVCTCVGASTGHRTLGGFLFVQALAALGAHLSTCITTGAPSIIIQAVLLSGRKQYCRGRHLLGNDDSRFATGEELLHSA